jgi:myo-inositol-1(or 4)-monophosphatase
MSTTPPIDLSRLCTAVCEIARATGSFILSQVGEVDEGAAESKELNSLVSYVDRQAEEQLVSGLGQLLPGAGFLTEEETVHQSDGATYRWIIDPLDGTTNFLFQLPCFSVSVALEAAGELVLGVVYEINREECFYAWQDGGAWLNGRPIHCRHNDQLANSLLATGFPYYDFSRAQEYLRLLSHLMKNSRGIRRWGSAAVDLAYTAAGRFDGFYEATLNAWDVAAGIVLVREAGGVVTDFRGHDNSLHNGEIVAASRALHPALLAAVKAHTQPNP